MTLKPKARSVTGVKPTGCPHLGNYFGAIKPAIDLQDEFDTFYFVANFHAQTANPTASELKDMTYQVAASFLAFGLDPEKGAFFRQSDIPEVTELAWVLSNYFSLGDLFRAHSFKAAKDKGEEGKLNVGTFNYPILMAADILLYDADIVPVGKDQVQHLEMTRAMAQRLNHYHGNVLKEPKERLQAEVATVPGIDGRKMSKSYNNGIEPLLPLKELKKQVMAIVTDSKGLEDVKDPETCNIFALYKLVSSIDEQNEMRAKYKAGNYGYGHAKLALLEKLEKQFADAREKYAKYKADEAFLETVFAKGAAKARPYAKTVLQRVRKACGLE